MVRGKEIEARSGVTGVIEESPAAGEGGAVGVAELEQRHAVHDRLGNAGVIAGRIQGTAAGILAGGTAARDRDQMGHPGGRKLQVPGSHAGRQIDLDRQLVAGDHRRPVRRAVSGQSGGQRIPG